MSIFDVSDTGTFNGVEVRKSRSKGKQNQSLEGLVSQMSDKMDLSINPQECCGEDTDLASLGNH